MADVRAVVSEAGGSGPIAILDLTTTTTLASIPQTTPSFVVVLPDASQAYTVNGGAIIGLVYPTNLPAYTAGTSISVGTQPTWLAVSPDGSHIYSASSSTGTITPIATPSNVAGAGIVLGGGVGNVGGVVVNPASTMLYATTPFNGIVPVSIPSNTIGAAFGSGTLAFTQPQSMVVMPAGTIGYVGTAAGGGIFPIDLVGLTVGNVIDVPGAPQQIFLSPDATQIFALDGFSANVYVISTASNTLTHTIPLTPYTNAPNLGGFDCAGTTFYFTVEADSVILAINTGTYALSTVYPGIQANSIAIIPTPGPPPTPPYPGGQFIPNLFIPIKGKVSVDYTAAELMADWLAIEIWSQRWLPPAPVTLFFPDKHSTDPQALNANWIVFENWVAQVTQREKAPYPTLFIPRKNSNHPTDLDINFHRIENWANGIAHG